MNKKMLLMLLTGTILTASQVYAQKPIVPVNEVEAAQAMPRHFDRKHHQAMAAQIATDLGLTDEQKAQAEKIREEGRQKIAPLMEQMKVLRQQIDEERRQNMNEFERILTPEQQERFNVMKNKAKRFAPGPRQEGEGRLMRGIHKIGPDEEMRPSDDEPNAQATNDNDYRHQYKEKHHKKHKKTEKAKGGFIDTENVYQGGGFVEK